MRDRVYPPVVRLAKGGFRALGQRLTVTGAENIPRVGGALLASNHVSYLDFIYAGLSADRVGRLVRFMAKKEIFDTPGAGALMRGMHHIPVDRSSGSGSYRMAVDYLRRGELVGIFPEATISRAMELKELKAGAVRIAAEAGVPLLPVIVWGTQRVFTKDHPRDLTRGRAVTIAVGEALHPAGLDPVAETEELKAAMSALLDRVIREHPDQEPGAWWVPRSHGGTAPSLERAHEMDVEEKRLRAERKAAKAERKARRKARKS